MKWCKAINMWCSDIDIEYEYLGCDGKCNGCDECEEIGGSGTDE